MIHLIRWQLKYNGRVPKEFDKCPLCHEKIFFWKHFINCKFNEQKSNELRVYLNKFMEKQEIKWEGNDVIEKLLLDQQWNFIQRQIDKKDNERTRLEQ